MLLLVLEAVSSAGGTDWPQFMGPNGDGSSLEKGLLRVWPNGGPKVVWTVPLGKGFGGAAIRDGKVYILDRLERKQDILRCLDLATGKEQWRYGYDAPGQINHEGPRSTPAVADKYVYAIGPFGHLHCIDRATYKVVWKKNIVADYGGKLPQWMVAQSPLLYKDIVIVAPQTESVGIVALDQVTGNERWRSEPLGLMAYASAKLISIGGVDQIVIVNTGGMTAVEASDGKVLCNYPYSCKNAIPSVSALGDGKLFVTGGYNAGSAVIRVLQRDGGWGVAELARIDKIGGQCHPGLVYKEHIYILCNTNERADGMVCFSPDGKLLWQTKRDPYLCKGGSILTGDGLIYVMDGSSGELHIVEPSPAGFKSLSKAKLLDGEEIWGELALSDGRLLIRDQSQLKCVDVKGS
jgi:outer membrane protein assembly factor BamB